MDKKMKIVLIIIMIAITSSAFVVAHVKEVKKQNNTKTRETIELDSEELKDCNEVSTRLRQGSEELEVKAPGTFKSYMDGSLITDDTSEAYWQIRKMYPDENGIYSEGFYKGIAMASYYGKIGDKFKVTLSSGKVFWAVMTDIKQERHVDENYACKDNGSLIEFIVDEDLISYETKLTGSLETVYPGQIISIEKIEEAKKWQYQE